MVRKINVKAQSLQLKDVPERAAMYDLIFSAACCFERPWRIARTTLIIFVCVLVILRHAVWMLHFPAGWRLLQCKNQ